MPNPKMIIAALSVTVAFSAVAASSAPAAEWFVGGKSLVTGQVAIAPTAAVTEAVKFRIPKLNLTVTCTGILLLREGVLRGPNSFFLGEHGWSECTTTEPTVCSLVSNKITTNPLKGSVTTSTSPQDRVTFTPQTKSIIAVVAFTEGSGCALEGEEPVRGSFTQKLPTGQTESESQVFEGLGSIENNSLEVGSFKVYIEKGKSLVKQASGSKWSFH